MRSRALILVGVIVATSCALGACGLTVDGIGIDAEDASADGTSEGSSFDALNESAAEAGEGDAASDAPQTSDAIADAIADVVADVIIDAGVDAFVDSGTLHCGPLYVANCVSCPGAPALCGDTCVASCHTACAAATVQCAACNAANALTLSLCVTPANATSCISGANVRCTCPTGDAGECAGPTQVCNANQCLACGEMNTDTKQCKAGPGFQCDNSSSTDKFCH